MSCSKCSKNIRRDEAIKIAQICGIPGAENGYKSPYITIAQLCQLIDGKIVTPITKQQPLPAKSDDVAKVTELTGIEKAIDVVDATTESAKAEVMLDFIDQADVESTSFVGSWMNKYAGVLYFLKNYKDACTPMHSFASDDINQFGLSWWCNFDNGICTRELKVPKDFIEDFRSCLAKKNVRFIFGNITLYYSDSNINNMSPHANAFVVDLKDRDPNTGKEIITVEIFEPNGAREESEQWYDHAQYIAELRKLFGKLGAVHVYEPGEFCPVRSFQSVQGDELSEALASDPGGFCQAWSLWWIEFRLKNAASKKTRQELVKMAMEQLQSQKDKKSLTKFIRNYAEFIIRERNKILEDAYNAIGQGVQGRKLIKEFENASKQRSVLLQKKDAAELRARSLDKLLETNKKENDTVGVDILTNSMIPAAQKELVKATEELAKTDIDPKVQDFFLKVLQEQLDKALRELHSAQPQAGKQVEVVTPTPQAGKQAEVVTTPMTELDTCRSNLKDLGLRAQECTMVLNNTKNDLLTCKSSVSGWERIQSDLTKLGMTVDEADRIIVAVGKHLLTRVKSGENLDSLLKSISSTSTSTSTPEQALSKEKKQVQSGLRKYFSKLGGIFTD